MNLIRTPNSNSMVSYAAFCHQLGQSTTPELMQQIFKIFDTNQDDYLNFRELLYSLDSAHNRDIMNKIKLMFQIFSIKKTEIEPKNLRTIFDDLTTMFPTVIIPNQIKKKMVAECYSQKSARSNDLCTSNINLDSKGEADIDASPRVELDSGRGDPGEIAWPHVPKVDRVNSDKLPYKTFAVMEEKSEDLEEYMDGTSTKKVVYPNGETKCEDLDNPAMPRGSKLQSGKSYHNNAPLTPKPPSKSRLDQSLDSERSDVDEFVPVNIDRFVELIFPSAYLLKEGG